MELPAEIIQETGLNETQIQKITEYAKGHISELEGQWGAKANVNAERIIEGAAKKVEEVTGVTREKGQKLADYLTTASEAFLQNQLGVLKNKEVELNEKIKKAGHSETLVNELETVKSQLNKLKEKEALFSDWETNDYKGKYETISKEYEGIKIESAFNSVKPAFPENVNKYEADFKWNTVKKSILEKYDIKIVDGEPMAVDKENEYKTAKLSDLVKKNEEIVSLLKGEQNKGFGSKPKTKQIEGVPFEVPENVDSKERTKLIKEYLAGQNISVTDTRYAKMFAELNSKILSQKTA